MQAASAIDTGSNQLLGRAMFYPPPETASRQERAQPLLY
jgi:hypothetical protein